MFQHLNSERDQQCRKLYCELCGTDKIMNICLLTHPCLYCNLKKGSKLKTHLKKTASCGQKYFEQFNVGTLDELKKKMDNMKSVSYPSRTTESRRDEDKVSTLEKFRKTVANGPHTYPCVDCFTVGARGSMFPINDTSLIINRRFYRDGIVYQCAACYLGQNIDYTEPHIEPGSFLTKKDKSTDFYEEEIGMIGPLPNRTEVDKLDISSVLLLVTVGYI